MLRKYRFQITNNILSNAVILTFFISAGGSGNLLMNGDFAHWESSTQPTAWIVEDTTKAKIAQNNDIVRSSPYSCKITRMVTGTGNNYGLRQFVNVTPGMVYTFSAWFYDDDINARGGLLITWCRNDSTAIRSTTVTYTDSSIHTWQKLVRTDTAPDSAVYAKCLLRIYGFSGGPSGGIVFVDDAEMTQGTGSINETDEAISNNRLTLVNLAHTNIAIRLTVSSLSNVNLAIFDIKGSKCVQLHSGNINAGTHAFYLDDHKYLTRGVYFVVAQLSDSKRLVSKLVISH